MRRHIPGGCDGTVTQWLLDWSAGNENALDELMPLIYDDLQRQARACLRRERPGHTLETCGLVNEAFLRLIDQEKVQWQGRAHFFAIAGRMMRRILVDHARRLGAAKRGGEIEKVPLVEERSPAAERRPDILALDAALGILAREDPEAARIVELRYFAGLNREEIALVLKISSASVTRRWRMARAWLLHQLAGQGDGV